MKIIEIVPTAVVNGFLDKPIRLAEVRNDIEALRADIPDLVFDEKQMRDWLRLPTGQDERLYTPEERARIIEDDYSEAHVAVFGHVPLRAEGAPVVMGITFGAPGTGKTELAYDLAKKRGAGVVDVNEVQKTMGIYYQAMDSFDGQNSVVGAVAAYAVGRWAANYAANRMMNESLSDSDIIYGTTATSPATVNLHGNARNLGVYMPVFMVVAPESVRLESCKVRCWGVTGPDAILLPVQDGDRLPIPQAHIIEKNLLFGPMVRPHMEQAREVEMYFRGGVHEAPVLAAHARGNYTQVHDSAARLAMVEEIAKHHPAFSWGSDITMAFGNQYAKPGSKGSPEAKPGS